MALNAYISDLQNLLHDVNGNFWTTTQLTGFINEARKRIAGETGCLRTLQTFTLTAATETYGFSSLPQSMNTLEVLNLTILWGNTRIPLDYRAWTEFNAELRPWTNLQGRPSAYSAYGETTIYVSPVPDQAYTAEWDTLVLPNNLTTDLTAEQIVYPYTRPVIYLAASLAKFYEQKIDEAKAFEAQYFQMLREVAQQTLHRRIRSVYSTREID